MKCSKENFVVEERRYFEVVPGKYIWSKADIEGKLKVAKGILLEIEKNKIFWLKIQNYNNVKWTFWLKKISSLPGFYAAKFCYHRFSYKIELNGWGLRKFLENSNL